MPKGDGEGSSNHIRTFLRIRPSTRPSGFIKVDEFDKSRLDFHVPVEHRDGEVGLEEFRRRRKGVVLYLGSTRVYAYIFYKAMHLRYEIV